MARPARPWFRFYTEALADRKLRRLTPAQRWLWVAVLGAARMSPIPGVLMLSERDAMDEHDLADVAGMTAKDVAVALPLFERSGMIDRDEHLDAWRVSNWADRQYESDNVTERTRKHRSNEQRRNVPSNGETTPQGTPPESETETESDTEPVASTVVVNQLTAPDDPKSVTAAVARARAHRLGRADPTPGWLRSVADSLDPRRAAALHAEGLTPAEIDIALDAATPTERGAAEFEPAGGVKVREVNGRLCQHIPGSGFVPVAAVSHELDDSGAALR